MALDQFDTQYPESDEDVLGFANCRYSLAIAAKRYRQVLDRPLLTRRALDLSLSANPAPFMEISAAWRKL
jgi:hypothetical protein